MPFLGTEHSSNQNEGDDSGGEDDEGKEHCNIREANAGLWRRTDVRSSDKH